MAEVYFTGRYLGFDLEDPDWPDFRIKLEQVARLLEKVRARVAGSRPLFPTTVFPVTARA